MKGNIKKLELFTVAKLLSLRTYKAEIILSQSHSLRRPYEIFSGLNLVVVLDEKFKIL